MRANLLAAVLLAAAPAMAQGGLGGILHPKPQQPTTPQSQPGVPNPNPNVANPNAKTPSSDQAKMAIDVAEVELQASKLYLSGLADLASKPTTWDRAHTVHLFNEAQRSVIRAEQQLNDVEALAVGNFAKAAEPIRKARMSLVDTEHQLRSFSQPMRTGQYAPQDPGTIKNLWNSVDQAQKDIEGAAGQMGIDFHLKGL